MSYHHRHDAKRDTKKCPVCEREFAVYPSEVSRRRYCSRYCRAVGLFHSREVEVFMSHVTITDGCWIHDGPEVGSGYAKCSERGRTDRAHRWSYKHFIGPIPDGLLVRHKCDVPRCVNPDHLELGTHQQNMDDMTSRGRRPKGEETGRAKLTNESVREIRHLLADGYTHGQYTAIGRRFGVHRAIISRIAEGRLWAHVT